MRGTPRAVGTLAGTTPARSWRDDLLALLAERRSLVEVRDWATARGVHYRDEVLPLLEEWAEQGLVKSIGEAKEKRLWATKPGEPLPDVEDVPPVAETPHRLHIVTGKPIALDELPDGMRAAIKQLSPGTTEVQSVPDGAPIGIVLSPPTPYRNEVPVRQRFQSTELRVIDAAILVVLGKSEDPMRTADVRAALADRFSAEDIMIAGKRLRHHGRIVVTGVTHTTRWALSDGARAMIGKPQVTAPAPKPKAPPVEDLAATGGGAQAVLRQVPPRHEAREPIRRARGHRPDWPA